MKEKTVNITPAASSKNLREDLVEHAQNRGRDFRPFVAEIYGYAVKNKDKFSGALKPSRRKPGLLIGATVPEEVALELTLWAKRQKATRGKWCCFILEKAIQENLLDKIFNDTSGK